MYEKVKDRITSNLLTIIQYAPDNSNEYSGLVKSWLDRLPLKADKLEYIDNHMWLASTMNANPDKIICNDM